MERSANALAELAKELKNVACEYADDEPIVLKAQRIVEELAKVNIEMVDGRLVGRDLLGTFDTYMRCRVIAEEEVCDGKVESVN